MAVYTHILRPVGRLAQGNLVGINDSSHRASVKNFSVRLLRPREILLEFLIRQLVLD